MVDVDALNNIIHIHNDTNDAKEKLKTAFSGLLAADLEGAGHCVGDAMCSLDEAMGIIRDWLKENGVEVE